MNARRASKERVYANEASTANFDYPERNRRLNGIANLTAHNLAVSDKKRELDMYL